MASLGAFTFVLHSHLPYARLAGRWPHGEEWIHEAASETYIPLLNALYDLRAEGVKFRLTIGITPVLAEQLMDKDICDHFDEYLDDKIARAKRDILRFRGDLWEEEQSARVVAVTPEALLDDETAEVDGEIVKRHSPEAVGLSREEVDASTLPPVDLEEVSEVLEEAETVPEKPWWVGNTQLEGLAQFYLNFYEGVKSAFDHRYNRDIVGAFRQLQDEGYIEIITCAATHGYLPLLGQDSAIAAQLETGVASYERCFGRKPHSIWLPECAYRPAYYTEDGTLRPGIEEFLDAVGLKLFFSETHLILGGAPVGVAAGDVFGPYGSIKRRYMIPVSEAPHPDFKTTTFEAYYVSKSAAGPYTDEHSGVSVIGRNNETGQQVWSADTGYPGDFDYREFHRKDAESGLQYWRVTGNKVDLGDKDLYNPEWAAGKVKNQAAHFVALVEQIHQTRQDTGEGYGLIASNYDTELFGHWWFEGVDWLREVLRGLAASPTVDLVTARDHLATHPPQAALHLPEGSWGGGGTHFTWNNPETEWMWKPIHDAEARMEQLASTYQGRYEDESLRYVLNQAARELLLLESSDWPFLVTTGQARNYAIQRFSEHLQRFGVLADSIEAGKPDRAQAEKFWEKDKLFPDIDYRRWLPR